jgi:putative redox protein
MHLRHPSLPEKRDNYSIKWPESTSLSLAAILLKYPLAFFVLKGVFYMVQIDLEYQGAMRCRAVHGPSRQELFTDAPTDNMGKGESFSPTDLVAAGLGSCIMTILGILADRHHQDLRGSHLTVSKEMADFGPRRISRLSVTLQISGRHPEEFQKRMERAILSCPVALSLHPDVQIPVTICWEGEEPHPLSLS